MQRPCKTARIRATERRRPWGVSSHDRHFLLFLLFSPLRESSLLERDLTQRACDIQNSITILRFNSRALNQTQHPFGGNPSRSRSLNARRLLRNCDEIRRGEKKGSSGAGREGGLNESWRVCFCACIRAANELVLFEEKRRVICRALTQEWSRRSRRSAERALGGEKEAREVSNAHTGRREGEKEGIYRKTQAYRWVTQAGI
jgi:hypothetical protein